MVDVILFGLDKFAEVVYYYFIHDSPYKIVAFTADQKYIDGNQKFGIPVIPFEEIEKKYPPSKFKMFIAIGYSNVNKNRAEKYFEAKQKGYELISYVCSKSVVWDPIIGDNCFIFENQTIQPYVKIGNNVVLWSGNHIGHHGQIGDHCFITSHVVISGSVIIEPYCFLGVNSTIRDGIRIKQRCVIGAGALITKDTIENGVYYGPQANILKIEGDSTNIKKI
jgi:sugar O-acyltransferase (sialic acid O-acetyltransferase NeuD family)